jgi:PAS domain S-box-containing protein
MYGHDADEAVGRPFTMVIASDRKRALREILDRLKRSRAAVTLDAERTTKKGERMVVASTVSPLRSPDGKIVAASVIERDITASKHAEERQRMLLAELNHRVKNSLASVLSISARTARNSRTIEDFREAFDGRIRALARAHELLAATSWAGADLRAVVQAELTPYGRDGRIKISGEPVTLPASAALILGIAFHELATNEAKYGAFSTGSGEVAVAWRKEGRMLCVRWAERNGPKVKPPASRGFGLRALEQGLTNELQGRARIDFPGSGVRCTLEIPLREVKLGKI